MMRLLRFFRMPLLWKALVEQAARKRTYIIRVLYAVLFFLLFLIMTERIFSMSVTNSQMLLGTGKKMFEALILVQFAGVYTFLPAMISGVITFEKERETLSLLFMTQLKPGQILFQKYLGRLIPMLIFILLGLPLMTIAYAYGGMTIDNVLSGFYLLMLAALHVGALGLMVSAYCKTSVTSFVATYIAGTLFIFGIPIIYMLFYSVGIRVHLDDDVAFLFFAPGIYFENRHDSFGEIVLRSIPLVISTVVFLRLAYKFLLKRAFVPRKNTMLKILGRVDAFMNRMNRITGGIILLKSDSKPLKDKPIEWREMSKRSLGNIRYRLRIFLLIWIPVLFIAAGMVLSGDYFGRNVEELSAMIFFLWCLTAVAVPAVAVNSITSEYSNQTLPVLLTTPMTGRSIIQQKLAVIRGMYFILGVPIITLFLTEAWIEYPEAAGYRYGVGFWMYLTASFLSVIIYFPMLTWFSMWISLKTKKKGKALILSLISIAVWLSVPVFILIILETFYHVDLDEGAGLAIGTFSPALMVILTEFNRFKVDIPAELWILLNYMFYAGITWYFRWMCLRNADRYLGRGK